MKTCIWCNKEKPEEEFAFRSKLWGTRQNHCKQCQREYSRNHYKTYKDKHNRRRHENIRDERQKVRKFIWKFLSSHPCVDCGENDPLVLEFDHVRGKKETEVSNLIRKTCNIKKIQEEIDKCEIRCANCHRRKTAKEYNWYKEFWA